MAFTDRGIEGDSSWESGLGEEAKTDVYERKKLRDAYGKRSRVSSVDKSKDGR